jgi:excisionase family DNA binding protein
MVEFENLYDLKEAAKIARVTRQTLYNHIKAGKLKATKIGRAFKITESNLKQYVDQGHN